MNLTVSLPWLQDSTSLDPLIFGIKAFFTSIPWPDPAAEPCGAVDLQELIIERDLRVLGVRVPAPKQAGQVLHDDTEGI